MNRQRDAKTGLANFSVQGGSESPIERPIHAQDVRVRMCDSCTPEN